MADQRTAYTRLMSLAVHELRTPISVVDGYLRMLEQTANPPLNAMQRQMIDQSRRSCARMTAMIAELSDIQKLDAGLSAIVREPLDFFTLVRDAASDVPAPSDSTVVLDMRGPAEGAPMIGDGTRLRTAIGAVLHALVRETPGPATIAIERRLSRTGGMEMGELVIASRGDPQAVYDSANGPFDEYRGGLGLALPLARIVIEAHGGSLRSPASADPRKPARGAAVVSVPLTT